ncbi:MAG: tetratricopeptide repeat protein [candidate division FCPU426 bacterium]
MMPTSTPRSVLRHAALLAASIGFLLSAAPGRAAVYEKYILVVPLRPANAAAQKQAWFGPAFRTALQQAALSMQTLVFLKDDELSALQKEFGFGAGEPEPGQMERVADSKEIAVLHGSYRLEGDSLVVECQVIAGRNVEGRTFKVAGSTRALRPLFSSIWEQVCKNLNLTVTEREAELLKLIPGTDSWAALEAYQQAWVAAGANPESSEACRAALPHLERSLKQDPKFVPALALRSECLWTLDGPRAATAKKGSRPPAMRDLDRCLKLQPENPLVMNAHERFLIDQKAYEEARVEGEKNLSLYPTNYRNYLQLAEAYRRLKRVPDAERLLISGLDQQGTDFQKMPFNLSLGLLLLKSKDEHAEIYLRDVLKLIPKNAKLRYLRAGALYRLQRYLDAMHEVQQAEAVKSWAELLKLKALIATALGNRFYEEGDFDRAYSYTTIAMNLRPNHFEVLLLLAKVMRKKGFHEQARQQLDAAQRAARKSHPKDHMWLGTEYVAQGFRDEGAKEYTLYLKLNPKAPERRRLISLIRQLQGETDE